MRDEEILATVNASAGRRWLGMVSLGFLGVMVIWIAFASTPQIEWRVFLVGVGFAAILLADKIRRATSSRIELTDTELRDSDGTVIAQIEDIMAIDRGFFAFKPSNGFLLKLRKGDARIWRPGLWWRLGRRVGVGGMTPGSQTKFMSEIIAIKLAERDGF